MDDPIGAVLSTCIALLSLGRSEVIQFSHFSVKEFSTSTHFADAAIAR